MSYGILLLVLPVFSAQESSTQDEIRGHIENLSSGLIEERVKAHKALYRLGFRAESALRAVEDHPDAEVRTRVKALLRQCGIY